MNAGILGLQGCCAPHARKFAELDVDSKRVLYAADLAELDGLVMPGGESSTMLKAATPGLWEAICEFAITKPVWGVCAGCILMARHVENPPQTSLGLINIDVRRNAYGAQNESFIDTVELNLAEIVDIDAMFIRAPQIINVDSDVQVLGTHAGTAIMAESQRHMVTTFHPELHSSTAVHEYFVDKMQRQATAQFL